MTLSLDQEESFNRYARNPETWVLAARRNLAVAKLLFRHLEDSFSINSIISHEIAGCHYASYFHAAMSIENATKAVLISNDPSIVSNGSLERKKFGGRSGHALVNPVETILGELTDKEKRFLIKLEEFIWAGRYTVPSKAEILYDKDKMNILRLSSFEEKEILDTLFEHLIQSIKPSQSPN